MLGLVVELVLKILPLFNRFDRLRVALGNLVMVAIVHPMTPIQREQYLIRAWSRLQAQ